jgi:hypothetical protein
MTAASRRNILLTLGLLAMTGTARAATQEKIGSWVLNCTGDAPGTEACLLRADKRLIDTPGVTGDLEIEAQKKSLAPVVVLRGLSSEFLMAASLAGKTEASIRLSGGPREDLGCAVAAAAYVCSPSADAVRRLAARLPAARSVTVGVSVVVAGMRPLAVQESSLDLSGTKQALARLRAVGPPQMPGPMTALASQAPGALLGMADKALKAAGYPNGAADLQALLAKYIRK